MARAYGWRRRIWPTTKARIFRLSEVDLPRRVDSKPGAWATRRHSSFRRATWSISPNHISRACWPQFDLGRCARLPNALQKAPYTSYEVRTVCRSIKTLFNFAPPATEEEIRAASLQFVRKLSGFTNPSMLNRAAFDRAVDEVAV